MPSCMDCGDTGVIETGNNDLPCHCKAGDKAIFNVAGEGQLTGAQIKRRDSLPQPPTLLGDRTEYGHFFKWYPRPGFWHSTSGQAVIVAPETADGPWLCILPDQNETFEFKGHQAEKRAFVVAQGFIHQNKRVA